MAYYAAQPGMMGGPMMGNPGMGMMGNPGMMGMGMPGMQGMGMGGMQGMGIGGMGIMPGMQGQMYRQLGYDYNLPQLGYKPDASWGAWDLANAQYSGNRLERTFFDNIISSLTNFFANRHLSEGAAREAHRRVYFAADGEDAGNKTLGGAAAYQAFLIWDRDHHSAYHSYPTQENRERLVGLAVAELFSLWDKVNPRSSRANHEEAAQYAAATAKYLFDRHYDLQHSHHNRESSRYSGYGADGESDSESGSRLGRHMRRKSGLAGGYNQPFGMPGQMGPGMQAMPGMGMPMAGPGAMMPGGMGMGMNPMAMQQMQQQQMMQQQQQQMMQQQAMANGMGGMGMPGMAPMGQMGMGGLQMGMPPHGSMGEMQAGPGMHPYTYGANSGVAFGNQPIDGAGNQTYLGGAGGRGWYGGVGGGYGYGQPRYY